MIRQQLTVNQNKMEIRITRSVLIYCFVVTLCVSLDIRNVSTNNIDPKIPKEREESKGEILDNEESKGEQLDSFFVDAIRNLQTHIEQLENTHITLEGEIEHLNKRLEDQKAMTQNAEHSLIEQIGVTDLLQKEVDELVNLNNHLQNLLETTSINTTNHRHSLRENKDSLYARINPEKDKTRGGIKRGVYKSQPLNQPEEDARSTINNNYGLYKRNNDGHAQNVAFSAHANNSGDFGIHQPVVFQNVITNIGHMYNALTGVFYCGVPGTYVFTVNLLSRTNSQVATELVRNGVPFMYNLAPAITGQFGPSCNTVVVDLDQGDALWVRTRHVYTEMVLDAWTTFSGYLLFQKDNNAIP